MNVDSAFPGGNIIVDGVDGDTVALHQDLRDTDIWWFYWHYRVRGAAGRSLTFQFVQGDVIGSQGPAISRDSGVSWTWLGRDGVVGTSFRYTFAADEHDVRFAFAPAYLEVDLHRFLGCNATNSALRSAVLCHTPNGRAAEVLYLGRQDSKERHRVLLTCRHHACESVASFALEGLMAATLADDPLGTWLREQVAFMVVPFVDKDGVEDGDQGKQRRPRDHNRDYDGEGRYVTTRAIRQAVPARSMGRLRLALDLHCPYIREDHSEEIYCVGGPDAENWEEIQRFSVLLEQVQTGPLPYRAADNLPFGAGWNTADNLTQGKDFARWAGEVPGMRMATTIEIPYALVHGQVVTPDAARALGRDLAEAIGAYLEALA